MTTPTRSPTVAEAQAAWETAERNAIEAFRLVQSYPHAHDIERLRAWWRTSDIIAEQAADTLTAAKDRAEHARDMLEAIS